VISKAAIANASGIARHVTDTTRTAEYYLGESVPSYWVGGACADLGISGPVDERKLVDQLEGRVTDITGERQLGRVNADGSFDRRMGWDFTISEPKSLSIEREAFGNQAVADAIATSNRSTLAYLEEVGGWTRIQGKKVHTGNLVIAAFEHVESRRGDMDVHTHALVMNTTTHEGKAYSLSNEELFAHRRAADALKQMEEGYLLNKAGYAVCYDNEGHVELAGYTRDQISMFSKGAAEVEAELKKKGLTRDAADWSDRNESNIRTRDRKSAAETREQAHERWRSEADAAGVQRAKHDPSVARAWSALDADTEACKAIQEALEKLTEREFVFTRAQLDLETAKAAQGRATMKAVTRQIDRAIERGEIVRDMRNGRLTTREAQAAEREMDARLEAGRRAHEAVTTKHEFEQALDAFETRKSAESGRDFHLNPEQRSAAEMILTGADRFQGVQGLPGTGKTTLLQFVREAAESKGWTVVGHSNGAEQAQKMEAESGIRTSTTASHLLAQERDQHDNAPAETRRELRIMDEASQSGQRQFNRVLRTSERAGAKTIFIGDKHQHQSVESGKAFELAQAHMQVAELGREAISRQTTGNAIAVVSAVLDKKYHDAMLSMDVQVIRPNQDVLPEDANRASTRFAARQDNQAVIAQIGRDYVELDRRTRDGIMVITGTNDDRKAINHAIRSELKSREELAGAVDAMTLQKVDMEKAAARRAVSFEAGQVIEAVTAAKRQNVGRGERFTVRVADSRTNTLSVIDDAGRRRVLDPGAVQFRAYNREVREFAPGDKVRFTENHQLGDGTRVRNGQRGEVMAVSTRRCVLTVRTAGHNVDVSIQDAKLDYSYATTSHSGQGRDERAAWIHHNTEVGRHGEREALVNATRAKETQRLYTQDVAKAERQMGIVIDKIAAHDVSNRAPEAMPEPPHSPQPTPDSSRSWSY